MRKDDGMKDNNRSMVTTATDERSRYLKAPAYGKLVHFLSLDSMRVYTGRWEGMPGQMGYLRKKAVYHIKSKAMEDLRKVKEIVA